MRRLQIFFLIAAIFLLFTGCEDKNVAIPYSEFSKKMEIVSGLSGLSYDYTINAEFPDESMVCLSGNAQLLLDEEKENIDQFSAELVYSVPNNTAAGSSSRIEMNLYWNKNKLYSSSMGMKYLSTASVEDALPILPTVLLQVPEEAVSGNIIMPNIKVPSCTVELNPEQLENIHLLFGKTFQTITGADRNYEISSLSVTYTMEDDMLSQLDLTANLVLPSGESSESASAAPQEISITASIHLSDANDAVEILVPDDLDSYNRNNHNNPLA